MWVIMNDVDRQSRVSNAETALPRWPVTRRAVLLGLFAVLGVGLLLIMAVWTLPAALTQGDYAQDADRMQAQSDARDNLITLLGALGLLGGLAYTARTFRLGQAAHVLSESGQIADRYTKAVDQLGSKSVDVRLGGVYALERIAIDSRRDHPTVVQVLSAFVREHSRPNPAAADITAGSPPVPPPGAPAADVQAALTFSARCLCVQASVGRPCRARISDGPTWKKGIWRGRTFRLPI
jgi:hypothetical protein